VNLAFAGAGIAGSSNIVIDGGILKLTTTGSATTAGEEQ
jgi:hypothetical protein